MITEHIQELEQLFKLDKILLKNKFNGKENIVMKEKKNLKEIKQSIMIHPQNNTQVENYLSLVHSD